MGRLTQAAACCLVHAIPAFAQNPAAPAGDLPPAVQPAPGTIHPYEVVSIKLHKAEARDGIMSATQPDGFRLTNMPLASMVRGAYGLILDSQVAGLPAWASQDGHDIEAKADAETAERWKKLTSPKAD